jgi:putative addiction module component (TIGR02574 family)
MPEALDKVKEQLGKLPAAERAELAEFLLHSLDEGEAEEPKVVEAAWQEELRRRLADVEAGRVELIPADEVFKDLREPAP